MNAKQNSQLLRICHTAYSTASSSMLHNAWWTKRALLCHIGSTLSCTCQTSSVCMNLLWGAFFSRGLSGLVAMSASSASQLVFGEQLNSWWDTPAATWNTPGDLWSSSTSCKSGMSSREGWLVEVTVKMREEQRFHKSRMRGIVAFQDFTIVHVAPGRGRQVLVTLEGVKGLVHSHNFLLSCPQNRLLVTLLGFLHHILVIGCWRQKWIFTIMWWGSYSIARL